MISSKQRDQLIKYWEEGLSGSQIGEKLNMTRNAVIGMVNRLRRKGHVFARDEKEQHKKRVVEARKVREEDYAKRHNPKAINIIPKDLQIENVPSLPTRSGGIELLDLKLNSCRFIISGDETPVKYCGEMQTRGSYCAEHYSICYYPARGNLEKMLRKNM